MADFAQRLRELHEASLRPGAFKATGDTSLFLYAHADAILALVEATEKVLIRFGGRVPVDSYGVPVIDRLAAALEALNG